MDDLITDFLTETYEALDAIDIDLVSLEQNPNNKKLIGSIFRLVHTIKGTCGFLGLPRLEKVAHAAENVMGRFRDGDLEIKPAYVTLIFESIDRVKMLLKNLENTGSEAEGSDADLIAKLDAVYESRDESPAPAASGGPVDELQAAFDAAPGPVDELQAAFDAAPGPEELKSNVHQMMETVQAAVAKMDTPVKDVPKAAPAGDTISADDGKESAVAAQSIRVSVDVLEGLMNMVSELVLTRNQLIQILRAQKESEFSAPLQRLNHVVSDLQEGVMKTRMQPVGNAWSKLPRIIRDLCNELGKKINLEMVGQDTELDRQVLEMIKDPLTHMVRNSGDHGIEKPADRLMAGKKETGTINLNAFHEGGHIIIEIADDGRGLNMARIRQKAIENNVATADEMANMTDKQIQQFIFAAGFSTAEKVTSVSGRGVGMDVVRNNIEKIGGTIDLESVEGKGSKFTIKIPLTLAIVSALIVECAGERYAVPQLSVRELVMVSSKSANKIEKIKGTPVYRLRDRLLPLVYLDKVLNLESKNTGQAQYIIVTQLGSYSFGIVVDKVFDTEEIVVKPVSNILKSLTVYSGNTILGDGSVIMIIDPAGIAKMTGEIAIAKTKATKEDDALEGLDHERTSLLVFNAVDDTPKAVPLSLVARLEEIDLKDVEHSDDNMLIQYRGELMPLVVFDKRMELPSEGLIPTIVFSNDHRSIGIVVSNILDIVEDTIDVQINGGREGLLGSAIIQGKATDIVDVGFYLGKISKSMFGKSATSAFTSKGKAMRRVLLVDDSPFFRNMLTPLLQVAGYDVTPLNSAREAQKLCDEGQSYDVIVSDIEMPEMNGFEFAEWIQNDSKWKGTPMVALSSHTHQKDIDKGYQAGFSEYVAKFDRDRLLVTLSDQISRANGGRS